MCLCFNTASIYLLFHYPHFKKLDNSLEKQGIMKMTEAVQLDMTASHDVCIYMDVYLSTEDSNFAASSFCAIVQSFYI